MNEKWSKSYKKSIDCNNPKGFSQKAHCAGREKRQQGESIMSKPVNEQQLKEVELFLEKNVPTNPSKWSYYKSQAKKKFDVYPSAYANAWAAKMYKKAGGGWRTKKESIDEFQRDRQLRDPKKEMLIVKDGKVIVINKKDFDKYKRKGWIVAEGLDEKKNIKVTFRSNAAKQKYMKKQSLQPNSKEIVNQTDTSLTLTPDMKDYVSKKSHSDLIYQVDMVNEVKLNDLVGNQYKYVIGSGEQKYLGKNDKKYVLEMIAKSLEHYLYDHDFALNYLDGSQRKQYESFFEKEVLKPMLSKIDFTLNNFFTLDKDKVKWTLSSNDTRKMVDEIFRKNKKIPIDIKREYYEYRLDYAGVKLKESVNEEKLKPKKLTQLKKGEKFVFNNTPYEFVELYTDISNAAKVKKEDGKTSVVSFGGGVVNKNTKSGFSDYLKQGGRVWDNVNPNNSPSVNERYRPNLESKGWEAAQKVIKQLQSSVFRKLDDDELLEFRKAIADAFNLDGVLKETTINESRGGMDIIRRIVKNHQYEGGVDVQTANMILKVYDKVDNKTKKFLDHATLKQIVGLILKSRR